MTRMIIRKDRRINVTRDTVIPCEDRRQMIESYSIILFGGEVDSVNDSGKRFLLHSAKEDETLLIYLSSSPSHTRTARTGA